MSKKIKYTNEPIEAEVIADFLPPPQHLVVSDEGVKVTIALSRRSIDFFKAVAEQHNTSYQRMIRRLLDSYTDRYGDASARPSGRDKAPRRSTRTS